MTNEQDEQRLRELFRRAPAGVLALAALLGVIGGGLVGGGTYVLLSGGAGLAGWASVLLLGPLTLYVALSLVRLTRWAWLSAVVLLLLLLASSVLRALVVGGALLSPLAEVAGEVLVLLYLLRPRIRGAFASG